MTLVYYLKTNSDLEKNHSTETALVYMVNDWYQGIHNGKMVGVIFIDLKKAFDLVDLDLLLCKLKYSVSPQMLSSGFTLIYLIDHNVLI